MSTTTTPAPERNTKTLVLDVLSALARFYMAYVWLDAGIAKLGVPLDVTKTIEAYEIFTPAWSDLLAQIIGPLELAGGLLLLLGIKLRWSGAVSLVVLGLFIAGLWSVHARGMVIDCGCFDPAQGHPEPGDVLKTIWRDLVFVAVTVFMMIRPFRRLAIYP